MGRGAALHGETTAAEQGEGEGGVWRLCPLLCEKPTTRLTRSKELGEFRVCGHNRSAQSRRSIEATVGLG